MPLTTGKMQLEHERKIKRNILALKRDMDAKDLVDYFIEKEIFDFPDAEKINGYNPNTTENRNNCFFQLLFQSGDRAFEVFLYALQSNQQDHLVELIVNTQLNEGGAVATNEPYSWINTIPPHIRNRRLTEKDISRFAQSLGTDWEMVMISLGLSTVEIQHGKMENMTPVMQIYSALHKWRMKNPDNCTLNTFVDVLKDCQATTIDWEQIKRMALAME